MPEGDILTTVRCNIKPLAAVRSGAENIWSPASFRDNFVNCELLTGYTEYPSDALEQVGHIIHTRLLSLEENRSVERADGKYCL